MVKLEDIKIEVLSIPSLSLFYYIRDATSRPDIIKLFERNNDVALQIVSMHGSNL